MDTTAHDPEVQALLDLWAGLRRWVTRAAGHCWRALVWRVGVIGALTLVWSLLWLFANPPRPAPVRSHYRITQAFDQTGRRVTRQEWTDRALRGVAARQPVLPLDCMEAGAAAAAAGEDL